MLDKPCYRCKVAPRAYESYCKPCRTEITSESRNRPHNQGKGLAYSRARGSAMRDILATAKIRAGCSVCGYREHADALDFNHFQGQKRADITKMVTYSMSSIIAELRKCVVLCSNCHRIWTHHPEDLREIHDRKVRA